MIHILRFKSPIGTHHHSYLVRCNWMTIISFLIATSLQHLLGTRNRRDVHSMSITSSIQGALETPLMHISRSLCSNPDVDLNTPLHIAAKYGHMSIVEEFLKDELLRQDHVKLDARNLMNKTPAHLAAEYGHYKYVYFSQVQVY